MSIKKHTIYSDISFSPQTKSGVAGFIHVKNEKSTSSINSSNVHIKHFQNTTCTRLEIEGLIWAIQTTKDLESNSEITIYTDCKTITNLPKRRVRLEKENFKSKSTGLLLSNRDLYIKFFSLFDSLQINLIWTKGHKPQKEKNEAERLFSIVDKTTRRVMRATSPKKI